MSDEIDLGKLSDREILILLANNQRQDRERLNRHGSRIAVLEKFALGASTIWAAAGTVAFFAKDAIGRWIESKSGGH